MSLLNLLRDSTVVSGASIVSQALSVCSIVSLANTMGIEKFGLIAIAISICKFAESLCSAQPWQGLIITDSQAQSTSAHDTNGRLSCAIRTDVMSVSLSFTLVTSTAMAIVLCCQDSSVTQLAILCATYSSSSLVVGQSSITGLNRIIGDVGTLAVAKATPGISKFIAVQIVVLLAPKNPATVLTVIATVEIVLGSTVNIWILSSAVRRQFITGFFSPQQDTTMQLSAGQFNKAALVHNWIKSLTRDADVLVVGLTLGAIGAGIYKLIKQVGACLNLLSSPLSILMLPRLSRAIGKRDSKASILEIRRASIISSASATAIAIAIVLSPLFPSLLPLSLYNLLVENRPEVIVYLCGGIIGSLGVAFHAAQVSLKQFKDSSLVLLGSTTLFYGLYFTLYRTHEVMAIAISFLAFYIMWTSLQAILLRSAFRRMNDNSHELG